MVSLYYKEKKHLIYLGLKSLPLHKFNVLICAILHLYMQQGVAVTTQPLNPNYSCDLS